MDAARGAGRGRDGTVGGRVVRERLSRGAAVRALVREGSDATRLTAHGVEVARGDLIDPASLEPALGGVRALITAAG